MLYQINKSEARLLMTMLFCICSFVFDKTGVSFANETTPVLKTENVASNPPGVKDKSFVQPGPEPEQVPFKYPLGVSMDTTFISRYIWQGLDYSDQKPTQQSEVILTFKKISGIVWFNYDFQTFKDINEYDLTLQYGDKIGPSGIVAGYTYLTYPHRGWSDSEEIWVQGTYDHLLNPTLSLHDDFNSGRGWYYSFGISHPFEWPIGNLTPAAFVYYHDHYYGNSGFPSAEFDLTDAFVFRQVTSSLKFSFYRALNAGDFKNLDDQFVYSLNLSWSLP